MQEKENHEIVIIDNTEVSDFQKSLNKKLFFSLTLHIPYFNKNLIKNNFNFSIFELMVYAFFLPLNIYKILKFHNLNFSRDTEIIYYVPTKKNLLIASTIKIILKGKLIFHAHNVYPKKYYSKIFFYFFGKFIDEVIVASKAVQNSINHSKSFLIYNPLSKKLSTSNRKKSLKNVIRLGSVSSLIPYKGIEYFLQSSDFLKEVKFSFEIYGEGYLYKELESKYKFANFHGFKDMNDIYRNIDLLIVPSIEPEAFSLVILEAMSHGIPVIATNIGAHIELIENNKTGCLVDIRSPKQIANSVLKITESNSSYEDFSLNCIDKFHKFLKENDFKKEILPFFV